MILKLTKMFVRYAVVVGAFLKIRQIFSNADDFLRKKLGKKPILYLLEYHVAEHCNLKCKGCFHFSNLVQTEQFPSLEKYRADLLRLSELFGNIRSIRLMGGEPLLNPQLPLFIQATKEIFPLANIFLLTNGLLYKKINGELLAAVKLCNVEVQVSLYKPMISQKSAMQNYFDQNGLAYSISQPIQQFAQYINVTGDSNPKESVKQCPASRCTFLSNGNIARCPMPFNISYFTDKINMQQEKINIYDQTLDGFALKQMLSKPMKACRYCGKLEWFDWQQESCNERQNYKWEYCGNSMLSKSVQ
ncbi:MAG: 4Fe-4S cluster-binding domain-containing protein [Firmicutes bacterium]|nr:4Fe-4S cluster-binding domain-containing protein [Bacillota bacterium]